MLKMKKMLMVVLAGGIVGASVGCAPSAQEHAVAHQADVQQQIIAGFVAAKPAAITHLDTSTKTYGKRSPIAQK